MFQVIYDTVVMVKSESQFQTALDAIFAYCEKKCLTVNIPPPKKKNHHDIFAW